MRFLTMKSELTGCPPQLIFKVMQSSQIHYYGQKLVFQHRGDKNFRVGKIYGKKKNDY